MKSIVRFLGLLFIIMFTLKLLGELTVSWWIVTLPLWGPLVVFMAVSSLAVLWFFAKDSKGIYK